MSGETHIQFRRSKIVDKDTIHTATSKIYFAFVNQGLVNDGSDS